MNGGEEVTRLLSAANGGDRAAYNRLYQAVYAELHRIAASHMRRENRALTLQPTALVNEACLRMGLASPDFDNRRHFFSVAAESMRRILVEHARNRDAQKRGADFERVTLSGIDVPDESGNPDVLEIDGAIDRLALEHPRLAELVTLRFFAGLSIEDAAQALDISPATAKRDWAYARAWLRDSLTGK